MRISIQIRIDHEDGQSIITKPVAEFRRESLVTNTLGLTLTESKSILQNVQSELAQQQVEKHIREHRICKDCSKYQQTKDHHKLVYRTLFGKLTLKSPRLYACLCTKKDKKSISPLASVLSERISPELQFLQTKWASLVSYGMTSSILEEVLPIQSNVSSIVATTHKIAERLDSEIQEVQFDYGSQNQRDKLPYPDSPLTVGIDGGYIHAREGKNRKAGWFEAIVGKSLQDEKPSKRFGFVCKYDNKPKSRLNTMLQKQGLQMNQDITFLSDGGDTVRNLQTFISPQSEHILDWFHITMKITVMRQTIKGLDKKDRDDLDEQMESIKWNIWHGNVDKVLDKIESFCEEIECQDLDNGNKKHSLKKWAEEFYIYIKSNQHLIPNYAERYRHNEIISTSFVESTVNEVISKRMSKKQQMRWTKEGAHKMIQTRISTLNDELKDAFCNWYPSMLENNNENILTSSPHF